MNRAKNAKELEQFSRLTSPTMTPRVEMEIARLRKAAETLRRQGWEVHVCNEGTIHVLWILLRQGTKHRVCRVVEVTPV